MGRDTLTGSRIRERRLMASMRQADLARQIGISASYLNLIEHNRRRIGGKLLLDIAEVLGVEVTMLTEGAEAALIATLREAAVDAGASASDVKKAEEFAGRFPGWAEVMAAAHRRIALLERTVETLSDRLAHDPHLAGSLHEVLSTAASIRSTASILAEDDQLEQEWRDRFHKNLNEDSLRLAESSKALVGYLDETPGSTDRRGVPQEEAEAFIATNGHHFQALETGQASATEIVSQTGAPLTDAGRQIAQEILERYKSDAEQLPQTAFLSALARIGLDPMALAREFSADLPVIFRRLATLPEGALSIDLGLVVCDASGSILFRKAVAGFALPRFGASCPLWPVFTALNRPLVPVRRRVSQLGRSAARFECQAIAWPEKTPGYGQDPIYRSTMLIIPVNSTGEADEEFHQVGSTCRVCPRDRCPARREPSILSEGF